MAKLRVQPAAANAATPAPGQPTPAIASNPKQPPVEVEASTPDPLKVALMASGAFDPSMERKEFKDNLELWKLYLKLKELDRNKLKELIESHGAEEPPEKIDLRRKLASVINLVPTVIDLISLYLFSEEPAIDVKGDKDLDAFLSDCDGDGTPYQQFIRDTALPLSLLFGWLDVLVQNPLMADVPQTMMEADDANITARVFPILPTMRINWSVQTNGQYNWVCFKDRSNEDESPFRRNVIPLDAWVTISAANEFATNPDPKSDTGYWIRSWRPFANAFSGSPPAPPRPIPKGSPVTAGWVHEADWTPCKKVPVATLYYKRSNDPESRHSGISKVATIAILTYKIIQVLSWTDEDILANLAILAIPVDGGKIPKNEDGSPKVQMLNAFSALYYSAASKNPPTVVQGEKDHIEIKLRLVELLVREILRLAYLVGASGEAEKITSGVQGMVMRTELHRELSDEAANLDRFTIDIFALVKSWRTGEEWTRERVLEDIKPVVSFFKGPYTMDPVAEVVRNVTAILETFRAISPTMCEASLKQLARAFLAADDQDLPKALKEIKDNTGDYLKEQNALEEFASAAAAASGKQAGSVNITDKGADGATDDGGATDKPANKGAAAEAA